MRNDANDIDTIERNDHFAYIIGCTSGGAAYGITWEEWNEAEESKHIDDEIPIEF